MRAVHVSRPVPTSVAGLAVSRPHDAAEQAATRAGERVLTLPPVPATVSPGPPLPSLRPSWLGAGAPLDAGTRAFFEPRLGRALGDVRVHTDDAAAASADALRARAYTVGRHVAFGRGGYAPSTLEGRRLLAHELAHVGQQALSGPAIHRAPMRDPELQRLDQELQAGGNLTMTEGEIGAAADAGRRTDPPGEDPSLPITMKVYPWSVSPFSPRPVTTRPPTVRRALIVGGVHGDERGALQLVDAMKAELDAGGDREFDTFLVPRMNPWGARNNRRENRRGVDLNRNFPGLTGFRQHTGPVIPEQPEVRAVRRVIELLRPHRILALHSVSPSAAGEPQGGVFADPVEGPARELAARMAFAMPAANVPGNRLSRGAFGARYPGSAEVSVTTAQSSLGAWASAPTAAGGRDTTVITHEVSGKSPLDRRGRPTSASFMPGLREFLVDHGAAPSVADSNLRHAVTTAFLTGEQTTPAEIALRSDINRIVRERFSDMAAFYRQVWRPAHAAGNPGLPARLTIVGGSGVRSFAGQAGIVRPLLAALNATNTDPQIQAAVAQVLTTRSLPGFSRHHWGTDIDVVSATAADWQPPNGRFVALIPFLRTEARRFGFFHPFAAGAFPQPSQPHYNDEPWHLSYAPIAGVLQAEWAQRVTGQVLNDLIARTAAAIRGNVPQARMEAVLRGMNLPSYQTNVASP